MKRILLVIILLMAGCAMVVKNREIQLDDIDNLTSEKRFLSSVDHVKNKIDPLDRGVSKLPETLYSTDKVEKKFDIAVNSDAMSLNELVTIMLAGTGLSYTAGVDVLNVYVNIQGAYTLETIIDILGRMCEAAGYRFIRSGEICIIERNQEKAISGLSVMGYRCKYVVPSGSAITTFLGKVENIYLYVGGMDVIAIGTKSDVEVLKNFLGVLDKNVFSDYKVAFVVCPDVTGTSEKVKTIFGSLFPDALTLVNVIPVSSSVVCVVSRVAEYVEAVKTVIGLMANYMDKSKEIFTIPVGYKKASDTLTFIKQTFPDYVLSADDDSNNLYLKGSVYDYQAIKTLLENYDICPEQILFKVYLLDVKSNDNLDMGSDWFVDAGKFNLEQSKVIYPLKSGFNSVLGISDAKAFFSMLQKKFDAKVVSRPIMYMRSGQSGEVKFGSSVPFIGTKSVTSVASAGVVQNVTYRDVGIILKLTANVAENKNILVDAYIENSALVTQSGVENNPVFTTDSVKTIFVVPDGATCVLGGVKITNREEVKKGLPYLVRYIPLVSYVVGSVSKVSENRELLMCICPNIVNSDRVQNLGEKILKKFNYRSKENVSQN
ncbi:MAG: hypothetical protein KGJ87_05245 [Planctomycetota bacterium]|nr:hypothetical protein [Planctomycetota bacterium]